jgi:hypothetical protein
VPNEEEAPVTNKSMIDSQEAKKREAGSSGKNEKPLADEAHPHSPQLKPAVDERRGGERRRRQEGNKSRDL